MVTSGIAEVQMSQASTVALSIAKLVYDKLQLGI